jgi:hypothetical protein
MLDAAVQQSRRHQGSRLNTKNRYETNDDRLNAKADSSSRKSENGIEQATSKFYERIRTGALPRLTQGGQDFHFDIFRLRRRLFRFHGAQREIRAREFISSDSAPQA